ncbi:hypothetical protein QVM72_15460 [Klebsiella pneumoniae]|uniref:hypothetical protein n=1 Tax=Klebsiella pneumoniae TaxID=573 RepID=UPI003526A811
MTDITELAQSKSLRKKLNRRLNDAYGFQRTSGGKHTTISLSIDECKSIIAAMDERLALVEALEKAQDTITEMDNRIRKQNRHVCELFDDNTALRQRIAELESRTVTVKLPNQTQFDDPLSAYEAIEKCKEALTAQGIKWEAE